MVSVKVSSTQTGSFRVIIPKAIADALMIKTGNKLEVIVKDGLICYKK